MAKPISWRDAAIETIASTLLEYEAQCACLSEQMEPAGAKKWVNDRYPFGMRKYDPYKTWLQELKLLKIFVESGRPAIEYKSWRGRVDSKGRHTRNKAPQPAEGQMSLI